jgi:hypothetical protein
MAFTRSPLRRLVISRTGDQMTHHSIPVFSARHWGQNITLLATSPSPNKLDGDEMMRMPSQVVMRSPQCYSLLLKPTLAVPNIGLPR